MKIEDYQKKIIILQILLVKSINFSQLCYLIFLDFPTMNKRMFDTTNYISQFNEEFKNLKNKIHIIFYMLQNDSSRVLQDKEIELIEKFIENHIPIFLIANRVQKNNIKTFIRKTQE